MQQLSFFDGQKSAPSQEPLVNFSLRGGTRGLSATWKERASDNIDAIRLMQRIEGEFRAATPAEAARLIKFTGFGASELANGLFPAKGKEFRRGWETLGHALHAVAGRDAAGLARATQYAHFTPEFIVSAMWDALRRLGFSGGRVLEPGMGTGLFFALAPEDIAQACRFVGVERDAITARIARLLYPLATIHQRDFTEPNADLGTFDLVIGNPPFSDRTVRCKTSDGQLTALALHDFFIASSLHMLRPGGLAAFVVSRYTMDKGTESARLEMDAMADLLGAVRMPKGSMAASAGTDVVVDIMLFQRRIGIVACARARPWIQNTAVECEGLATSATVNRYFAENPDQVLGRHAFESSQFGPAYTCLPYPGLDLTRELGTALENFTGMPLADGPGTACVAAANDDPGGATRPSVVVRNVADGGLIREGSYFVDSDVLWQVVDGRPEAVRIREGRGGEGIFPKHAAIIRALIPIRDAVRALLHAQEQDAPSWEAEAAALRDSYANFTRRYGPVNKTIVTHTLVNHVIRVKDDDTGKVLSERTEQREQTVSRRPNLAPFLDDPDVWLVASIENYDVDHDTGTPGAIFTDRVIRPPAEPVIKTATDALAVVLNECGVVNLDRVAQMLSRDVLDVLAELGEAVFEEPASGVWQTADEYLSGLVRTKLATATAAAESDPERFERNAKALLAVQPADLKPSEITARLGAPWIPSDVVELFILQAMNIRTKIHHTRGIAAWTVEQRPFRGNAAGTSEWGTKRRHAGDLLEDALNSAIPRIYDIEQDDDGRDRKVFNADATEAAKAKLEKIKRAFEKWVWNEAGRADRLVRIYNDEYNNLVPRHFDGSHLQLPGASNVIALREHQKRVIWRIIASGATYIAHCVGAGKSFVMAAAIMEQKRLGMISKPMMAVPGHCLAQAAREFLMLYPTARLLVADETNFVKEKRQRFIARAATGNWDCIIITHSAFKFIPAPGDFERALIEDQLAAFEEMLLMVDDDDRMSRKRLERLKESFEEKLHRLDSRKDDVVTIAQMGVDQIVVDEAQDFRKLQFATNMATLRGIDPDGSQRAWDLYVKTKYVDSINPGRAILMASGTPITNTMGEMFNLLRFMAEHLLVERSVHQFDAWASTFGETRTDLELQPSGLYKPATRFSQFVNVPELISMFRSVADVVLKGDLRDYLKLPRVRGGKREIVTAKPSAAFRRYQKELAKRIKLIEERKGMPKKGDDIILSVIGDGRHAALDMRFTGWDLNEPDNKLNAMIANAFRIWRETSANTYVNPATGLPYELPGAAQMIFSDLGTLNALETRGFSAYAWIKAELIRLGVPAEQIAIMQHYKKLAAKAALFADVNAGRKRFLIGSSETMGTGVNAQQRLKAMHHLDVPWLPSWIEQREGRIERQGNQNEEIEIYAYATTGSMDATMWQTNERKARFIDAALGGDKSVRRLDDVGDTIDQFAFAKALSSGDPRLMQKAGLDADIARLERLRAGWFDDQYSVRERLQWANERIARNERLIPLLEADLARRADTKGDHFAMTVLGVDYNERKLAGAAMLGFARAQELNRKDGEWSIAEISGFVIKMECVVFDPGRFFDSGKPAKLDRKRGDVTTKFWVQFSHGLEHMDTFGAEAMEPIGLVMRIENMLRNLEGMLTRAKWTVEEAKAQIADFAGQVKDQFEYQDELDSKTQEVLAIDAALARNDAYIEAD